MTTETQTVTVLRCRVAEAEKALEKLARKARRYGCSDITVRRGEERVEKRFVQGWNGQDSEVEVAVVDLLVEGEAPRYGDHEFLARIELTASGCMVDTRPGVKDLDPRFRTTDSRCEHCNTNRRRNDVYAVRDTTTGRQLQVGRTCLRDYLGIDDPAAILARFRLYHEVRGEGEGGWGHYRWCQTLQDLLELAAVSVRVFGWCSKGQAAVNETLTPTASYVQTGLRPRDKIEDRGELRVWDRLNEGLDDQDRETAQEVIRWVRNDMRINSDYEHNLSVMFSEDLVHDAKRVGLIISAVAAYHRHVERELRLTKGREIDNVSVHLGTEGERLRGLQVTQEMARVVGGNSWGEVVLVKFRDADGNILTWFTGSGTGAHNGEELTIDGTVKRYSDYNGHAETQLTRVRVH